MSAFGKAAEAARKLLSTTKNEDKLRLYALYKQAASDAPVEAPSVMKVAERAKWEAWSKLRGLPNDKARSQYIALVRSLSESGGVTKDHAEQPEWNAQLSIFEILSSAALSITTCGGRVSKTPPQEPSYSLMGEPAEDSWCQCCK